MPSRRSAWASNMTPPSELIRPPSKAAVILLWQTAGKQNGQERFMREDMGGLLRDKTRPGCELLEAGIIERVVALTAEDPPGGKAPLGCTHDGQRRVQHFFSAADLAGARAASALDHARERRCSCIACTSCAQKFLACQSCRSMLTLSRSIATKTRIPMLRDRSARALTPQPARASVPEVCCGAVNPIAPLNINFVANPADL
jgi:hypothetical protein